VIQMETRKTPQKVINIRQDLHEKENRGPVGLQSNSPIHKENSYEYNISYQAKPKMEENIYSLYQNSET